MTILKLNCKSQDDICAAALFVNALFVDNIDVATDYIILHTSSDIVMFNSDMNMKVNDVWDAYGKAIIKLICLEHNKIFISDDEIIHIYHKIAKNLCLKLYSFVNDAYMNKLTDNIFKKISFQIHKYLKGEILNYSKYFKEYEILSPKIIYCIEKLNPILKLPSQYTNMHEIVKEMDYAGIIKFIIYPGHDELQHVRSTNYSDTSMPCIPIINEPLNDVTFDNHTDALEACHKSIKEYYNYWNFGFRLYQWFTY